MKGVYMNPSLRRHYPDQVYGYDLRSRHEAGNTPGTSLPKGRRCY